MLYKYVLERAAAKFLETIPKKEKHRIIEEIEKLMVDPWKHGVIKLKEKDPAEYRTRCGNYRIVFIVEGEILLIKVIRIFIRGDGY